MFKDVTSWKSYPVGALSKKDQGSPPVLIVSHPSSVPHEARQCFEILDNDSLFYFPDSNPLSQEPLRDDSGNLRNPSRQDQCTSGNIPGDHPAPIYQFIMIMVSQTYHSMLI